MEWSDENGGQEVVDERRKCDKGKGLDWSESCCVEYMWWYGQDWGEGVDKVADLRKSIGREVFADAAANEYGVSVYSVDDHQ